jgi:nucleotide-binding universal stress UspA family protein
LIKQGGTEMLPFKKILWPTDFSDPSYESLKAAAELAGHFSADLHLLHVIPPIPLANVLSPETTPSFDLSLYQEEQKKGSEKILQEVIEQRLPKGLSVHPLVVLGHPVEEILQFAQDQKMDLIVIATRGRTGLPHFLFGSVAEKVVRLAPIPVLVMAAPHGKPEEVSLSRREFLGLASPADSGKV